jgi:hypothetical protein
MANFNCAALTGKGLFTGNVGVGTAAPVSSLDVIGNMHIAGNVASPNLTLQGLNIDWNLLTGGTGETDFINNEGGGAGGIAFMNTPSSGTPLTTLMFLTGGGSLGIGTTSPGAPLDVFGIGRFVSPNSGTTGGVIIRDATGNPGAAILQFVNNADTGQLGYILGNSNGLDIQGAASGHVGIYTGSGALTFNVNGTAGGTSSWTVTSDARLKTNITPLTGALPVVLRLQAVRYSFVAQGDRKVGQDLTLPDGPQVGFVAQDVAKVVPEAVAPPANPRTGVYGLMEAKLIPFLVEAIKAQQAEIATLQAQVAALQGPH